jgi:hypothetical protein
VTGILSVWQRINLIFPLQIREFEWRSAPAGHVLQNMTAEKFLSSTFPLGFSVAVNQQNLEVNGQQLVVG